MVYASTFFTRSSVRCTEAPHRVPAPHHRLASRRPSATWRPCCATPSRRPNLGADVKLDWFPSTASKDARILFATRALRGFADGAVSVLLARYLARLGMDSIEIGTIVTGTLLGSAALTLA